jgi:hypothetical protein
VTVSWVLCLLVSKTVAPETTAPRESVIKLANEVRYWGRWETMNNRANKTTSRKLYSKVRLSNFPKNHPSENRTKLRQINLQYRLTQFLARSKSDCQAHCHEISWERETHCARLRACQR